MDSVRYWFIGLKAIEVILLISSTLTYPNVTLETDPIALLGESTSFVGL